MNKQSIHKILIANRGEIAHRIITTAHKMGIETVLPVTLEEKESLPARDADEVHFLSSSNLADTYLNADSLIEIAVQHHADAIHPGYGFLSENAAFAEKVEKAGLIWIGPSSQSVALMGDKLEARKIANSAGLQLTKSISGSVDEIMREHQSLNFPLLIKAAAGGGGKGMKIAHNSDELKNLISIAAREALSYFGNSTIFVEEYLENPRHIEVQVFGDQQGHLAHLFERECSIQRRYQKIIEEAPSPFVNDELRNKLTNDALKLCREINYFNAGTIEFLVDNQGRHYFLEMNTRLQVEHPVTEAITGIDLVEEQIRVAMGLPLSFSQEKLTPNGHAIEARVYAENALNDFSPEPGDINYVKWPQKRIARTDTFFDCPTEIQPHFDPMLSKITAWGHSRESAIKKMTAALEQSTILGVTSNLPYLRQIIKSDAFMAGETTTRFTSIHQKTLHRAIHPNGTDKTQLLMAAYLIWLTHYRKTNAKNVFSSLGHNRWNRSFAVTMNEKRFSIDILHQWDNQIKWQLNGEDMGVIQEILFSENQVVFKFHHQKHILSWHVLSNHQLLLGTGGYTYRLIPGFYLTEHHKTKRDSGNSGKDIVAPIPGRITAILAKQQSDIQKGTPVLVLEAMKMENTLSSSVDGIVEEILVNTGDQVKAGQLLVRVKAYQKETTTQT